MKSLSAREQMKAYRQRPEVKARHREHCQRLRLNRTPEQRERERQRHRQSRARLTDEQRELRAAKSRIRFKRAYDLNPEKFRIRQRGRIRVRSYTLEQRERARQRAARYYQRNREHWVRPNRAVGRARCKLYYDICKRLKRIALDLGTWQELRYEYRMSKACVRLPSGRLNGRHRDKWIMRRVIAWARDIELWDQLRKEYAA